MLRAFGAIYFNKNHTRQNIWENEMGGKWASGDLQPIPKHQFYERKKMIWTIINSQQNSTKLLLKTTIFLYEIYEFITQMHV